QFRSGHDSVSNLYDLTGGRVLDIVEGRTENDCKQPESVFSNAAFNFARSFLHLVALFDWRLPCLTAQRHDFQRGCRKNDTPTDFRRTAPWGKAYPL
ncbi:hypothetical protein, partial [Thiolapillus sp.]